MELLEGQGCPRGCYLSTKEERLREERMREEKFKLQEELVVSAAFS